MIPKEEILLELKEVSPAIAAINRVNVYSVPLYYFDDLAGNIIQAINDNIAGQSFNNSPLPFKTPDGYFDNLTTNILGKIKIEEKNNEVYDELQQVAPLLNTIGRQMLYNVPKGYFENFGVDVQQQQEEKSVGKVVSFNFKKAYKYVAAAVVTGLIVITTFLFSPKEAPQTAQNEAGTITNTDMAISNISEGEIIDYLENNSFGPMLQP